LVSGGVADPCRAEHIGKPLRGKMKIPNDQYLFLLIFSAIIRRGIIEELSLFTLGEYLLAMTFAILLIRKNKRIVIW
jgi:hypothetical protein